MRESHVLAAVGGLRSANGGTLVGLGRLGGTLIKRPEDVLAHFQLPDPANGPINAINVRLKCLRGSALGSWDLTNCLARSLLESGGFRSQLHPRIR